MNTNCGDDGPDEEHSPEDRQQYQLDHMVACISGDMTLEYSGKSVNVENQRGYREWGLSNVHPQCERNGKNACNEKFDDDTIWWNNRDTMSAQIPQKIMPGGLP